MCRFRITTTEVLTALVTAAACMKFRAALSATAPVLLCEQVCVYTCLASDAASHEARGNMSAVMGKRGVGILGAAMLATSSTIADPWAIVQLADRDQGPCPCVCAHMPETVALPRRSPRHQWLLPSVTILSQVAITEHD